MTKEDVIREAWLWINVQIPFDLKEILNCNGDGWLKYGSKQSSMQSEFLEEKQWLGYFFYRPKSLQGVEDNNGWTKIESEKDLPKEDGMYKLGFFENSDKFYQDSNLCNLKTALCALKESHYTHYRQISEFKPPIF